MRRFSKTLNKIITSSGSNLHNISQASGVSNAYLAKLVKGNINRPGKAKITSILLSLNFTITDINQVLSDYDYQPLHLDDIQDILKNNRARKISGGNLPHYDHIYLDLLLSSMERIGGVKILTKERPSGVFMPNELHLAKEYPNEKNNTASVFRQSLTRDLLKERKQLFLSNINAGFRVDTYMCVSCFNDYLHNHLKRSIQKKNPQTTHLITQYFANALSLTLKLPQLHRMYLIKRCPYFLFMMMNAEGKTPKVLYPGRKIHIFDNEHDKRNLEGFTTDSPHLINHFKQEIAECQRAVLPDLKKDYPDSIRDYFIQIFSKYGLEMNFRDELSSLMERNEIFFH